MATLYLENSGGWRIQFVDDDGIRKSIRIPKTGKRNAENIHSRVESLLASKLSGQSWDGDLSAWVAKLPDTIHGRLSKAGLLQPRVTSTLAEYIDNYIQSRNDVSEGTKTVAASRDNMIEFSATINQSIKSLVAMLRITSMAYRKGNGIQHSKKATPKRKTIFRVDAKTKDHNRQIHFRV